MKKREIYFFIGSLRGGGAEKVCVNIANLLSERNYKVTICVLNLNDAVYQNLLNKEVRLIDLNVDHTRYSLGRILKFIKSENPKVLLSFNHQLSILLIIIRSAFKMDYKIISRNINMLSKARSDKKSFWHKRIVYKVTQLLYRKVDLIIAQSLSMKNDLIDNFNIHQKMIKVINNPVSKQIEAQSAYLDNKNKVNNKNRILFVGRLTEQKGLDYLLEAFQKVVSKDNSIRLKIVGSGPLKEWVIEMVEKLGLTSNVEIKGFTNDIVNEYYLSDVIALSSRYEGFPNVLIEAITLGKPVVSFDTPSGPSEIIQEGINGFLVEYKNVEKLAEKLVESLSYPWNHSAIVRTSNRYSSKYIIEQYEEAIKQFY